MVWRSAAQFWKSLLLLEQASGGGFSRCPFTFIASFTQLSLIVHLTHTARLHNLLP